MASGTFSSWVSFLLVKIGCTSWLIFLERYVSYLLTLSADLWPLNGNTIRTGFSIGVSHSCCRSVDLLKLLKVESIIFSGYFSFRNIVHCSVLKCSAVDDSRSARFNMVFIRDRLCLLSTWLSSTAEHFNTEQQTITIAITATVTVTITITITISFCLERVTWSKLRTMFLKLKYWSKNWIHIQVVLWSFKILITIVLALIYSFCFEDTVSLSLPIKRHDICRTPLYNSGVTRFESWTISHHICCNFSRDWPQTKMATETVKGSYRASLIFLSFGSS